MWRIRSGEFRSRRSLSTGKIFRSPAQNGTPANIWQDLYFILISYYLLTLFENYLLESGGNCPTPLKSLKLHIFCETYPKWSNKQRFEISQKKLFSSSMTSPWSHYDVIIILIFHIFRANVENFISLEQCKLQNLFIYRWKAFTKF